MRTKSRELMNEIIRFVDDYMASRHTSPSIRTISEGIGLAKSSVQSYLKEMDSNGMLSYDGNAIVTPSMGALSAGYLVVPVVGSIHCGEPGMEEEYIEDYIRLPESVFGRGDFYLLRAQGDSMEDAGISEGDLVLIKRQQTADEGDIIVALDENSENTLKQYSGFDGDSGRYILSYRNEGVYPQKRIGVRELVIQGVAKHVIKALSAQERSVG